MGARPVLARISTRATGVTISRELIEGCAPERPPSLPDRVMNGLDCGVTSLVRRADREAVLADLARADRGAIGYRTLARDDLCRAERLRARVVRVDDLPLSV